MASKIQRNNLNLVDIPSGAIVRKDGRVYMNTRHYYVAAKNGKKGYASHDKTCIGIVSEIEDKRQMYANTAFIRMFYPERMPERPERDDSIVIGPYAVVKALSERHGIAAKLVDTFGVECTQIILDMASYMLVEESAVFQHFPHWARRHILFSETVHSDSYLSRFLSEYISVSQIKHFKREWACANIGDGNVFFCYDSTNVNSQAEGVFLVQKGHAKDNPNLEQVNTDYVIRQSDGLPLTFMEFPGSVTDIAQAPEMICFLKDIKDASRQDVHPTLVCDRGYISEENVDIMDQYGVDFLLMLRSNLSDCTELLREYGKDVKSNYRYYFREFDEYGLTVEKQMFGKGENRYFHIIWNPVLESSHRKKLFRIIDSAKKALQNDVNRASRRTEKEWSKYRKWFKLTLEESDCIYRHAQNKDVDKKAFILKSFQEDGEKIRNLLETCGFYVLVSSQKMTALNARLAYAKRDCVEKVFRALKSSLGMDKIGVACDQSIHVKALIWFVASIIHSLLFQSLTVLRSNDRKHFTVPASVDLLDEITADRNLETNQYERRYQLTKRQKEILSACSVSVQEIDDIIADI